jgi:hypothetical protein
MRIWFNSKITMMIRVQNECLNFGGVIVPWELGTHFTRMPISRRSGQQWWGWPGQLLHQSILHGLAPVATSGFTSQQRWALDPPHGPVLMVLKIWLPSRACFRDTMWTCTHGSSRTSSTCWVRSERDMRHLTNVTLDLSCHTTPTDAQRQQCMTSRHCMAHALSMCHASSMWAHPTCSSRHATLTPLVEDCPLALNDVGTHYVPCSSNSTKFQGHQLSL